MKSTKGPIILLASLVFVHILQAQEVKYEGSFKADSYWTKFEGDWKITEKEGTYTVQFADNFETKKAPDLKIFLSKLPFEEINGENAADESQSVLIAELQIYEGAVTVEVPKGINPAAYQSIIVHCEKYAKLWGGASLK